jgi:OH-DDVA meta-cleavage compound hydrolase
MIIDAHAHVTAPDSLYVWKSGLVSHRGAHGRGTAQISDDEMLAVH